MKIEIKKVYKCEYCNKLYQIKRQCLLHEKSCSKNPDNNRACFGCNHLIKKNETIYYDSWNGETKRNVSLLYCNKLDTFLYPPKVEHKGNMFETDLKGNNPMPKTCKHYIDEGIEINNILNNNR